MNTIYRLIWSRVANAWVAVAECTRTRSKDASAGAASLSAAVSITAISMAAASAAPAGGVIEAGHAAISQSGSTTTISQASQNVSLNWNSFNVASGETVNFIQPSTSSLAINRIGGGSASQILGNVNANGQLYLVNPSGILFGRSAQVNVGGLIASTLDAASDSGGPTRKFSGSSNASVVNQGNLHAARGGYIGLLGSQVLNQGIITAQLGTVALAGGNAMTLTFAGHGLVNLQIDKSTFDTLVDNRGVIVADGGLVMMSAGARDSLLNHAANNSGIIEARGVEHRNGKIVLSSGGSNGSSRVSGTLDASADAGVGGTIAIGGHTVGLTAARLDASGSSGGGTITVGGGLHGQAVAGSSTADYVAIDANSTLRAKAGTDGDGGQVVVWSDHATHFAGTIDGQGAGRGSHGGSAEVSSKGLLDYAGSTNLLSALGTSGTLLLDPYNLTIAAAPSSNVTGSTATGNDSILNVNTLQTALGAANVVVATGAGGTPQAGNITVADLVQWNAATTLTLNAAAAITINAPLVSSSTGGLILNAGAGQPITATAPIDVGSFNLTRGNWIQNAASLPAFTAGSFSVGSDASFLRATGGSGAPATPWLLADVYGLQGMGTSPAYLAAHYALAANIDATSTPSWNGNTGFTPVGSSITPFTGSLQGRHYSLLNLAINRPALTTGVGLFGSLSNANVSDLALLHASVTGGSNGVGALAGRAIGTSFLSGITVTGTVAGTNAAGVDNIGGIVGNMNDSAALVSSASAANVSGYFYNVGSLAGGVDSNGNVLQADSATGNVSGQTAIGGLVGHSQATVSDSYATGTVTQLSGGTDAGGLIGKSEGTGSITRSYATGAVSGVTAIGGLLGANRGTLSNSYWNTDTSTRANAVGTNSGTVSGVNGVTTSAMHTQATFTNLDFSTSWYQTAGYNPTLRAGTTLLGGSGNLTLSTAADSATNLNISSLQNLLGVGNLLVATSGTLTAANAIAWSSATQLGLAASAALTINPAADLNGSGPGSALQLFSYANTVTVNGAALSVNNGVLGIMAPKIAPQIGVSLINTTLNVGAGSGSVVGTAMVNSGIRIAGNNYFNASGAGTITLAGANRSTGDGVLLTAGANLTTSGTVSLTGTSLKYVGLGLSCVSCGAAGTLTNSGGNLTLNGTAYADLNVGAGLDLYGATLTNAGAGSLTLNANSSNATAVYLDLGTVSMNNLGGGTFALNGSSATSHGLYLNNQVAISTAGNVSISGKSQLGSSTASSIWAATAHVITCNSGNLTITAGDATTRGIGFSSGGNLSLNNNGSGIFSLTGISAAAAGIDAAGATNVSTGGSGVVNLTGAGGGAAQDISLAASAAISLGSGALSGATGRGIRITSSAGPISLNNTSLDTNNGVLAISASNANTATGVTLNHATLRSGTATSTITGNTNSASNAGVNLQDSTLMASGAGSITVSGSSTAAAGTGVSLASGVGLTTQGTVKLTDALGSAAGTALKIGGNLTASSGNLTLAPTSAHDVLILSGALVNSIGSGDLTLATVGAGALTNQGAISQLGGSGSITISTADGNLTNAGTVTGGASAGAITLSSSGSGAIADAAGQINQAGSGAVRIAATGTGAVSADTISYSNAAANTLAISGHAAVSAGNAIASTGGALAVAITGSAVTLGPSIVSNGGNITLTGPTVLGTDATLAAGAGAIGFNSTIDGANNLTASGASITLAQAAGGATALGAVSLQAVNSLTLPSMRAASLLANTTGSNADLTINTGATLTASASGNAVTLAAGRNFINQAGAGAINLTGGGRWLVYSATPGADSFNSLDSGNRAVWASAYAGATPNFSQAGNRYVFGYQPTLTFSSVNTSKTYGADATAAVANAYTVSGLQAGVSGAFLGDSAATAYAGTPTVTSSGAAAAASVAGGPYAITVSAPNVSSPDHYALAVQSAGLLTVDRAPLAVTANDAAKTYDGLAYSGGNGVTYAGLVPGDTSAVLTGSAVYGGPAQGALDAGNYQLSVSGLAADNYAISYLPGSLDVGQAALTVMAANASKTYDGLAYSGGNGLTYAGLVHGETAAVLTGTPAFGGAAQGAVDAGNYALTASGLASSNYAINYQPGTLTVNQAALVVTASAAAKTYDGLAYTGGNGLSYTGLVPGDSAAVLGGTPVYGGAAQGATNAGSYALTASGLTSGNYAISYLPGALTIDRAALTASANHASKTYDGLAYHGGNGLGYSGLVHGETAAVLGGAPVFGGAAQGAVDAGDYALTASGLTSANYAISYAAGTLTVAQAPLSVRATDAGKTYDGVAYHGGNGVTYAGFVHGETDTVLTGTPAYAGAAQGAIHAGDYGLTASGLAAANYAISYLPGNLHVAQAALAVSANDASKTYDGLAYAGAGGVSYAGFVHGENASVLSGTPVFAAAPHNGIDVGSYALTASGLSANDYAISYLPGVLNVTPAGLVVTVNHASKTYDGLAYAGGNGLSYTGLVNGETGSVLSGTAVFGGSAQGAVNAGNYVLTSSGLSSANYTLSYVPGTLTVDQAPLTVAANQASKTYDGLAYSGNNSVTYSGFVHGENAALLTGTLTFVDHAQGAVNAGNYSVTPAGLAAANYAITYLPGNLHVAPAAVTVTVHDASKTYDGIAYTGGAGVSIAGLVAGETSAVLTGTLAYGGTAQGATNAGSYGLTASGLAASNYLIGYVPGVLEVRRAPLTISANDASKTYDGMAYSGSSGLTYTGLVHGESAAVLSGTPEFGNAIHAGTYLLTPAGLSAANYAIDYVSGTLTVTPAALVVTVNDASKTYDGRAYAGGNGVSYAGFAAGDTAANLAGQLVFGGSAQGAVHAGSYGLSASGLSSGDYALRYIDGRLTVNQAALTVTANNASKIDDGSVFTGGNGVTYAGLVAGDTDAVVTGTPLYGGTAQGASRPGAYSLTAAGLASADYAIAYLPGVLQIGQALVSADASRLIGKYAGLAHASASDHGYGPGLALLAAMSASPCAGQNWPGPDRHRSPHSGAISADSRACQALVAAPARRPRPLSSPLGGASSEHHYRP